MCKRGISVTDGYITAFTASIAYHSVMSWLAVAALFSVSFGPLAPVGTLALELESSATRVGTLQLTLEDSPSGVGSLFLELEDSPSGVGSLFLELEGMKHPQRMDSVSAPDVDTPTGTGSLSIELE